MFRKVTLVQKDNPDPLRRTVIERGWFRFAAIQHLKKKIRASQGFLGAGHSLTLDLVGGVAQPCGIEQADRYPAQVNHLLDCVARGAGLLADDCTIVTKEAVE